MSHTPPEALRERERITAKMVEAIDNKIKRLAAARTARIQALRNTRSDLARATSAAPDAPEDHANIN